MGIAGASSQRWVWAAEDLIAQEQKVIAPAAERELIESPELFWEAFQQGRFHDYAQQPPKSLLRD